MVFQINVSKSSEAVFPINVSNNEEAVFQLNVSKNNEAVNQSESLAITKRGGQRKKKFLRNKRMRLTIDPNRPKGLQEKELLSCGSFINRKPSVREASG